MNSDGSGVYSQSAPEAVPLRLIREYILQRASADEIFDLDLTKLALVTDCPVTVDEFLYLEIDVDSKGYIDGKDIARVFRKLSERISDSEAEEVLVRALDGRRQLLKEDFMYMLSCLPTL